MHFSSIVALCLALAVQCWPQFPAVVAVSILPVIPYSPVSNSFQVDDAAINLHMPRARKPGVPKSPAEPSSDIGRGLPQAGTLALPIIRAAKPGLAARSVEIPLESRSDVAYYAQLDIGTPPQTVYAQLDTGSFELWINPDCSALASADQIFCNAVGKYDPADSSTSDVSDSTKTLSYSIGEADITYVTDDISLSDSKLQNVRFGVASSSEHQFAGVLGLGYGDGLNTKYKNFLDELADQGVISTKTFSLALGSKDEEEGVVVFGGVDTAKFEGVLAPLPIIPASDSPDGVARYWVTLESISLSPPGAEKRIWDTDLPVFFDSGATLTLLPPDLIEDIAVEFGSSELGSDGYYSVDCAMLDLDGTVNFAFDGVTIDVSYREIIREIKTSPLTCYLGIAPSTDFALLGDTFLRSAYVVFDLEDDVVHVARYANCGTKIEAVNNVSELKGLTGVCGTAEVTAEVSTVVEKTTTETSELMKTYSATTTTKLIEATVGTETSTASASKTDIGIVPESTVFSAATSISKLTASPTTVEEKESKPSVTTQEATEDVKSTDDVDGAARRLLIGSKRLVVVSLCLVILDIL